MIKPIAIEGRRAVKLARLWTALDAQRGSTYIYDARHMVPRPDIRNFGVGRHAAFAALSQRST